MTVAQAFEEAGVPQATDAIKIKFIDGRWFALNQAGDDEAFGGRTVHASVCSLVLDDEVSGIVWRHTDDYPSEIITAPTLSGSPVTDVWYKLPEGIRVCLVAPAAGSL